jgi:hypothetical protein
MVTSVSSGRRAYIALGVVLASVASVALAATFNLFQPASGILKGNPSTYITTAATSADVVATFSGTCNSGTVLKGDGSCAAASTGTVTSVALTAPTGLTVTGSPITTSGTLGLTTTLSGVVHGNGSGFTAGNVALGSEVSGLLPVANGGIGVGTLTGLAKGNGTSAFTSAVASDVYGLWAGGCSSSNFLRGDGTCASPGGGGTVTSVGMSVPGFLSVAGSPVTSSGTLAVSFSGSALPVANGGSGATTLTGVVHGNGTSAFTAGNVALGSEVSGTLPVGNGGTGTTTSTGSGNVVLSASPTLSGTITGGTFSGTHSGDGSALTNLNASNLASGTVATARLETTGTTTCNLSGMTGTTTTTIRYTVVGDIASLRFGLALGTSNSTGMSCPGGTIPAAARPNGGSGSQIATVIATDNGNLVVASARVVNDGSINFGRITPGVGFTASGSKGFGEDSALTYTIN